MTMNQKLSSVSALRTSTLVDEILANVLASSTTKAVFTKTILVVLGSVLLALSAQFKIPLYPVPITAQTLVVLLIGMTYGARLGGITIVIYLVEGIFGLPVFAGGSSGFAVLAGPTGGYLFGFLIAAIVMGYIAEKGVGRTILSTICAMLIGNFVIYFFGVWWLSAFICFGEAISVGVIPFLYGDTLKLIVASGLMPLAWHALKSSSR